MSPRILLVCLACIAAACSRIYKSDSVRLYQYKNHKREGSTFRLTIPRESQKIMFESPHGTTLEFWAKDSSLIYISDDDGLATKNQHHLTKNQKWQVILNTKSKEKMVFNGRDEKGMNWREIRISGISYGYYNVPDTSKEIYEYCIGRIH
jgi:hypothetical protein